MDKYEFLANDVFAIDVVISTNEEKSKAKEGEYKTTIFKRNID